MPKQTEDRSLSRTARLSNPFGLGEALGGFALGIIIEQIALATFDSLSGHPNHPSNFGQELVGFPALWAGLLGAVIVAAIGPIRELGLLEALKQRYGLSIVPKIDIPLGVIVGVASQYLLVPLLELPLVPFVPHLDQRLSQPANSLTAHVNGAGLALLGILVCVGSPIVEELFFRGLLLRALLGRFERLGGWIAPCLSIVFTGALFGLAHFEALQLIALVGFGCVLGFLAYRTGRLGPGIVAHLAFNATTFIAIAFSH